MRTKKALALVVAAVAVALAAAYFALQQREEAQCSVLVADMGTGVAVAVLDPKYKAYVGGV